MPAKETLSLPEAKADRDPGEDIVAREAERTAIKHAAAAEEKALADRLKASREEQDEAEKKNDEPVNIMNLAGKGYDQLHEAMRKAQEANKKPEYVPPPMTERQLTAREEELEAGRRSQRKAQEQWDNRPQPKAPVSEGFTTPVYRPNDVVPDPLLRAGPSAAGTKKFSPDV